MTNSNNNGFIALRAIYEHSNPSGDNPLILEDKKFYIRLDSVNEISAPETRVVFDSYDQFKKLTGRDYQQWRDDGLPHKRIVKICKSTPIGLGINGSLNYVWITEESYIDLCNALGLDLLS